MTPASRQAAGKPVRAGKPVSRGQSGKAPSSRQARARGKRGQGACGNGNKRMFCGNYKHVCLLLELCILMSPKKPSKTLNLIKIGVLWV